LNNGDSIGLGKFRIKFEAETAKAFGDLPSAVSSDTKAGMTLQMSPETNKRIADDHSGRVRGHVILPRQGAPDPRTLGAETFQVGKGSECDLVLKGWFAPKKAAMIVRGTDKYTIVNVGGSPRAVSVNEQPVPDRAPLADNDRIDVFGESFRFSLAKE